MVSTSNQTLQPMGNVCWLPCKAQQLATSSAPFQPDQQKKIRVLGTCAQRQPKTPNMKNHETKQNKKRKTAAGTTSALKWSMPRRCPRSMQAVCSEPNRRWLARNIPPLSPPKILHHLEAESKAVLKPDML